MENKENYKKVAIKKETDTGLICKDKDSIVFVPWKNVQKINWYQAFVDNIEYKEVKL